MPCQASPTQPQSLTCGPQVGERNRWPAGWRCRHGYQRQRGHGLDYRHTGPMEKTRIRALGLRLWSLCFREEILLEDLLPEPRGAMSVTLAILKNSPAPKRSATAANPCRDAHAGKPRPLSEILPEELRHRNVSSRSHLAQERLDQLLRGRDHDMLTCNRLTAQTGPPLVQGRLLETDEWIECVLEGNAPVLVSARVSAC